MKKKKTEQRRNERKIALPELSELQCDKRNVKCALGTFCVLAIRVCTRNCRLWLILSSCIQILVIMNIVRICSSIYWSCHTMYEIAQLHSCTTHFSRHTKCTLIIRVGTSYTQFHGISSDNTKRNWNKRHENIEKKPEEIVWHTKVIRHEMISHSHESENCEIHTESFR